MRIILSLILLGVLILPGTALAQTPPEPINDALAAISDLVGESVGLGDLSGWRWTEQTYNDNALGCPGRAGGEARFVRGYAFTLVYRGVTFDYRASEDGSISFLCNTPDLSALQAQPSAPQPTATVALPPPVVSEPVAGAQFPCPVAATGDVPSRLQLGTTGIFGGDTALSIRAEPSRTAPAAGTIQPGEGFTVLAGPSCGPTFVWWEVQTDNARGWLAEIAPDGAYWLRPNAIASASEATINAQSAPDLTQLAEAPAPAQAFVLLTGTPGPGSETDVLLAGPAQMAAYAVENPEVPVVGPLAPLSEGDVLAVTMPPGNQGFFTLEDSANGLGLIGYSLTNGPSSGGSYSMPGFPGGFVWLEALSLLAIGAPEGIVLYDPGTQAVVADILLEDTVQTLAASPTGDVLAAGLASSETLVIDPSTRAILATVPTPSEASSVFSPDGGTLAIAQGPDVLLWEVTTQAALGTLSALDSGAVTALAFGPDILAAGGIDGADEAVLSLWAAPAGDLLLQTPLPEAPLALAFSPDTARLYVLLTNNTWQIWGVR